MQGWLAVYRRGKEKLERLVEEYGRVAIYTYFGLFGLVLGGFWLAMNLGLSNYDGTGAWAALGAAWVATKITQPLRIAATLVITPVVARVVRRA